MTLLIVLLAIVFMQIFAQDNPLHRDHWLTESSRRLAAALPLRFYPFANLLLAFLAAVVIALVIAWVASISAFLAFPLVVLVVIYSFGRHNFTDTLHDYFIAVKHNDAEQKTEVLAELFDGGKPETNADKGEGSDLASEHDQAFDELSVRAFERYFTAIFWFCVGGVFLCVFYRLVALLAEHEAGNHQHGEADKPTVDTTITQHCQRLMAWPASRLLHLSLLLVGNFSKAYDDVLESLADSTPAFLSVPRLVREAGEFTSVDENDFLSLKSLMKRCLVVWLAVIALIMIF